MRFIVPLLLIVPLFAQPPQPPQKGGGGRAPRNLKVLTVEEERPMMMGMRGSLGVMCTHCHVAPDYASDENPKKLVARNMMSMVKEINAKFPDGKVHVTCYTCHRGQTAPETTPTAAAPPPPPPPPPPPAQ